MPFLIGMVIGVLIGVVPGALIGRAQGRRRQRLADWEHTLQNSQGRSKAG
ncbi:hypothetical protein [Andreprevotia lacus]|jgi:gas vesicle protein|nr:hypothetical protein [Andreprevotia lacus]